MSKQMTLEQVRDILRQNQRMEHAAETRECNRRMADAIDAHLSAAKGEAVADVYIEHESNMHSASFEPRDTLWEMFDGHHVLYTHPASPDVVRDAERLRFIQRNYQFAVNTCGGCIEDGINLENEHIDAAMAALEGGE